MTRSRAGFTLVPPARPGQTLAEAIRTGLAETPKALPTRYLYDHRGSELFEAITRLPEYYPTRTETGILADHADEVLAAVGPGATLVEFGSGSSLKTRLLLDAAVRTGPAGYVPVDISADFLRETADDLAVAYPTLEIEALAAEYFDALGALPPAGGPRLFVFLGSNIGNLTHAEAADFLGRVRRAMRPHDRFLVGVDLVKDPAVLESAYDDRAGVTARFNLNLLARINRELDADFDLAAFRHAAPWDPTFARIEMRLYSLRAQRVHLGALGMDLCLREGEYLHTEWSHKYTMASFRALVAPTGLGVQATWTDERRWFALHLLRPEVE